MRTERMTTLLLATSVAVALLAGCSGDGTSEPDSPDVPEGALGIVTDEATRVKVWDAEALRIEAPRDLENAFEAQWESLEQYGIVVDDLARLVETTDDQGAGVSILEGRFEWGKVRDALGDLEFEDATYRGQELWEDERRGQAFALLEDRGQIIVGSASSVRDVLRSLDRGTGFLLQDAEHDLTRVLAKAGEGWQVLAEDGCGRIDVRGCRAVAQTVSEGQGSTLEQRWALLFRRESTAESELDAVDDYFDAALPRTVAVESVEQDSAFVIVIASVDEEDYTFAAFPPSEAQAAAARAEFHDISVAVTALMVENNLSSIPNPASANTAFCRTGTQDMTAFPDTASRVATPDKANDPSGRAYATGDKDGYLLFGHDITGDSSQASTVNYINFDQTTYCYTIERNGTVHQYLTDGTTYDATR